MPLYSAIAIKLTSSSTKAFAADIWATCFEKDPMDEVAGLRYRQVILEKGGSGDEAEMLVELLGRPPKTDAFLKDLGVSNS